MTQKEIIRQLELIENAGKLLVERCYTIREELLRVHGAAPSGAKKKRKQPLSRSQETELIVHMRKSLLKNQTI